MDNERLSLIEAEIDRRLRGEKATLDLSLSKLFDISFKLRNINKVNEPRRKSHPNDNIEPAR